MQLLDPVGLCFCVDLAFGLTRWPCCARLASSSDPAKSLVVNALPETLGRLLRTPVLIAHPRWFCYRITRLRTLEKSQARGAGLFRPCSRLWWPLRYFGSRGALLEVLATPSSPRRWGHGPARQNFINQGTTRGAECPFGHDPRLRRLTCRKLPDSEHGRSWTQAAEPA